MLIYLIQERLDPARSNFYGYHCPHVSELAAYSKNCTLETSFEIFRFRKFPISLDTCGHKLYSKKIADTKISSCVCTGPNSQNVLKDLKCSPLVQHEYFSS